jgi:hypothetical protein
MNISSFKVSYNRISFVLKKFGLLRMCGIKTLFDTGVSAEFKKNSIKENYFKVFNTGLANYDFDFLLNDQSFFQFEFHPGKNVNIRYSFFQNPVEYVSYKDYLLNEIGINELKESVADFGSLFEEEYQQFLSEQELISNFVTLRYDLDFTNYQPLVHSVSHLHIGHLNNIRIPLNKNISPLGFVLFVIRHVYYQEWKEMITNKFDFISAELNKSHSGDTLLQEKFWSKEELIDLYLT